MAGWWDVTTEGKADSIRISHNPYLVSNDVYYEFRNSVARISHEFHIANAQLS